MFPSSSTETKIALLEERINVYEQMMERIDTAIQKIGETSQNISQMLAIHNEKIEQCNRTDSIIVKMIVKFFYELTLSNLIIFLTLASSNQVLFGMEADI